MSNEATRFKKGRSGNPAGRPKGPTSRSALRAALNKPVEADEHGRTRLEVWADNLASQTDPEMQLSILKFLEGNSPPPEIPEADAADKPQIVIPGLTDVMPEVHPVAGGHKAKRSPRNGKSS